VTPRGTPSVLNRVILERMGSGSGRLNVTLDEEYAAKLARLAERTHVQEGTLARSLLSSAIDEADVDPRTVVDILDGISGAFERAQRGLAQARAGETVALDEL
jgi:predicted transcriptional regulator